MIAEEARMTASEYADTGLFIDFSEALSQFLDCCVRSYIGLPAPLRWILLCVPFPYSVTLSCLFFVRYLLLFAYIPTETGQHRNWILSIGNGPLIHFGKDFTRFVSDMWYLCLIGQLPNSVLNITLGAWHYQHHSDALKHLYAAGDIYSKLNNVVLSKWRETAYLALLFGRFLLNPCHFMRDHYTVTGGRWTCLSLLSFLLLFSIL